MPALHVGKKRVLRRLSAVRVGLAPTPLEPAPAAGSTMIDRSAALPAGTEMLYIPQDTAETKQALGATKVRVALVGIGTGDHLSWANVIDQTLRYGCSSFLCAGIGGVGPADESRRKGYSTIVMDAAVRYMRDQHFPMTYLFGINNYYENFGYASVGV